MVLYLYIVSHKALNKKLNNICFHFCELKQQYTYHALCAYAHECGQAMRRSENSLQDSIFPLQPCGFWGSGIKLTQEIGKPLYKLSHKDCLLH